MTGKVLFKIPVAREGKDFLRESKEHGWPSFRDGEVVSRNVRILPGGEVNAKIKWVYKVYVLF